MVSASGFTNTAKTMAKEYDIDLYEVIDAEKHDWTQLVGIPALASFATLTKAKFFLGSEEKLDGIDPTKTNELEIFDWQRNSFGRLLDFFVRQWNAGLIPDNPGKHDRIQLTPLAPASIVIDGKYVDVQIYATYEVEDQHFYSEVPIINAKGFWDVQTQALVVPANSELLTSVISPGSVEKWERLATPQAAKHSPLLIIEGKHHVLR